MTHICVGNLTIIVSDNGLSPGRREAIIWTNAGMLLIGSLGTNFSEILAEIITFSLKKMYLKVSSAKWRPFCLGLNVLSGTYYSYMSSYPGYFREPHRVSMVLPEIYRVTREICESNRPIDWFHILAWTSKHRGELYKLSLTGSQNVTLVFDYVFIYF